ncbi:hypothetical protein D3C87_2084390 [compost metagenome]
MGLEKVPFSLNQLLGVLVIVGGILVFKLGGREAGRREKKAPGQQRQVLHTD